MLKIILKINIKNTNLLKGINLKGLRTLANPQGFAKIYSKNGVDETFYANIVSCLFNIIDFFLFLKNFTKKIFLPITVGGEDKTLNQIKELL